MNDSSWELVCENTISKLESNKTSQTNEPINVKNQQHIIDVKNHNPINDQNPVDVKHQNPVDVKHKNPINITKSIGIGSNQQCEPEDLVDGNKYLPQEYRFEVQKEPISVKNRHLINITKPFDINTIGTSIRNPRPVISNIMTSIHNLQTNKLTSGLDEYPSDDMYIPEGMNIRNDNNFCPMTNNYYKGDELCDINGNIIPNLMSRLSKKPNINDKNDIKFFNQLHKNIKTNTIKTNINDKHQNPIGIGSNQQCEPDLPQEMNDGLFEIRSTIENPILTNSNFSDKHCNFYHWMHNDINCNPVKDHMINEMKKNVKTNTTDKINKTDKTDDINNSLAESKLSIYCGMIKLMNKMLDKM